ncbi:MAG TPA: S41 family peptidase [Terriglobales bacterium]|nr:S41 family peptidase [Terriglobales bacterium]
MSKPIKILLLALSTLIVLFTVAGGLGVRAAGGDGAYRQLQVYDEVLTRIRSEYVEEPNMTQVTDGALHGLLESLDANSSYLTPAEYKSYKERKGTAKAGIGATLSKRFGYAAVISVIPGGPADKAGLEDSDILEAIAGKSTRDMSLAEIRTVLSGEPGSTILVSVVRARRVEPQKITLTRDAVKIPPASERMMEDGVGYIKLDALPKGMSQEVAARVKSLQHAGAKKLVLDLRNVSEGDESEGIALANLFLSKGTITYLQGQKYPRETFTADPQKTLWTGPLAVLVNRGTAGAAEIAAAAILDNARGDVVGDKTFGVGSVQKLIEIPDGSALILSVAKYYEPNGKAIQDAAVTPSVLVADASDDSVNPDDDNAAPPVEEPKKETPKEDLQLQKALETLKKGTQKAEAEAPAAGQPPMAQPAGVPR